jgi:hypothetical protein
VLDRITGSNPGSQECLSLAKRWLDTCTSNHLETIPGFIPTRLIDLEPDTKKGSARLVSQRDIDPGHCPLQYIALSYCWGANPSFPTTNSANIGEMQRSIPVSELPQTIKDAITITRYLGIRYLWVDALCILQGDDVAAKTDWISESETMGQLYQSAHLTIAAASASSATEGILNERTVSPPGFWALPKSLTSFEVFYLGPYRETEKQITEPLDRRGWTLQETTLSTRLLKFGTDEMSWRCADAEEREGRCEVHAPAECLASFPLTKSGPGYWARTEDKAAYIYEDWHYLVEDFSKRDLTKRSDKLHAIAGMSRVAQKCSQDTYVAGIWGGSSHRDLLWYQPKGKSQYSRKAEFQAPAWSWVSVHGAVRFLRGYDDNYLRVTNRTLSKFSQLPVPREDSKMCLTGPILSIASIRCQQFGSYYGGYERFLPWMSFADTLKTYLDDLEEIPKYYKRGGNQDPLELLNTRFLLLSTKEDKKESFGAGIILLPMENRIITYRRIGMFEGFPVKAFVDKQLPAVLHLAAKAIRGHKAGTCCVRTVYVV